jgi:hypothetical protein
MSEDDLPEGVIDVPSEVAADLQLVDVTLPLHYAAIVKQTLEATLTAKGLDGARMLVTILEAFNVAVGSFQLPLEEDPDSDD